MSYDKKFLALNDLPPTPQVPQGANYILYRKVGNMLILSGNGPLRGDKIPAEFQGKLGKELNVKQGYDASRLTCMNLLLVARSALGSLDKVDFIVNIEGTVSCTDDFTQQPAVINGCSDLLIEIFGDAGKHTRSALGTNSLAFNIPVEISMTIALR
jgi:enamine deaminase RidA (YjgF/YER057c/UK114 family)